jgi:hypothetical protein
MVSKIDCGISIGILLSEMVLYLIGFNDRDKAGLPRLIEAMQSTMWSTAQRKTIPTIKSADIDIYQNPNQDAIRRQAALRTVSDQSLLSDDSFEAKTTGFTEIPSSSSVISSSSSKRINQKSDNDPSILDMLNGNSESISRLATFDEDEDGDDVKFFELFAASLAEARTIREKVLAGELSDSDRKNQAAAMARKLSDLLNLGDFEGDEDEDDI